MGAVVGRFVIGRRDYYSKRGCLAMYCRIDYVVDGLDLGDDV